MWMVASLPLLLLRYLSTMMYETYELLVWWGYLAEGGSRF